MIKFDLLSTHKFRCSDEHDEECDYLNILDKMIDRHQRHQSVDANWYNKYWIGITIHEQ